MRPQRGSVTRARLAMAVVVSVGFALILPAAASASKVDLVNLVPITNGYSISIKGQPGETNNITVGEAGGFPNDYRITDTAGIKDPIPAGCVRESATSIRCPKQPFTDPALGPLDLANVFVFLGDGDDLFTPGTGGLEGVSLEIEAGEGNDLIYGHSGGGIETLQGGPGDDKIITGAPGTNKELDGGGGNDTIIVGGVVQQPPSPFAGGGGGATIRGGSGNDLLTGGPQGDNISGSGGKDTLKGGGGPDKLKCGGGKDSAIGGGGRDQQTGCEKAKGI